MASKRKQHTVQFLFEASPENNITRCVISTTSNTFGNNEEGNCDDDRSAQIGTDKITKLKESINTIGNNEELKGLKQRSSARQGLDVDKESDEDYIKKTEDESDQMHTDKGILQEHESGSSTADNGDKTLMNAIPKSEHISHRTTEASNLKTLSDHNHKEQNACIAGDLYNTNQSHKLQGQEIHLSQTTMSVNPGYKNHDDFHNTTQQSPLSNPKDNESKEQFPVIGGSNHLEAMHESTKLSLNVGGKDKDIECEVINNFNAKSHDENESKYLHVIDYDIQEPVSVIRNFDYSESRHQSTKGIGNKTSDGYNEVYNNLNTTIQETDPKFLQDSSPDRQLPDQGNPRRLEGKQTNLHANIPSNNNVTNTGIKHIKFEGDSHDRKQSGNKVKNLIHDYELHVQGNSGQRKLEEKHENQFGNILNTDGTDTIQSTYTEHRRIGTDISRTNYVSPVNLEEPSLTESYPLHGRELASEEIINRTATKVSNTNYHHSMTKECNASDIPGSNSGKQLAIPGNKHSSKTVSGTEDLKTISATEVNNTGDIYSITKEGNASLVPDSDPEKHSLNGRNRNDYTPNVGKDHSTVISNYDQSSRSDIKELRSDDQLQTCTSGSQVTRAHWYDIHSQLQQSSEEIQQSKEENSLTPSRTENTSKSPPLTVSYNMVTGRNVNEMQCKRWKSLGELDTIDQVEEYKLPEKLNRTVAYPTNEQGMIDRNNNLDAMYFNLIPRNQEFNSIPRNHAIQNAQRLNLGYDSIGTETVSFDAKTVHRLPFPTTKNNVANMHSTNNPEKVISRFDSVQTHRSPDAKEAQQSPSLTRMKYVPNMYNTSNAQMIEVTETLSPDYNTANQSPSLRKYAPTVYDSNNTGKVSSAFENNGDKTLSPDYYTANQSPHLRKYAPTVYDSNNNRKVSSAFENNGDKALSSDAKISNHSPSLTRKRQKLTGTAQEVNTYSGSLLRVCNDNLSSSLTALETVDQSPMKRSRSPTRKREKLSGQIQKVNNSSDSLLFHQMSRNDVNNLKGYNNNLSSSLTSLETLDQSPMKRSPKIKNLVNIEYYDINSDEELNSKIKRRPRTKSLNEEDRTVESVTPRRVFKSSGDLRSVGLNHKEINVDRKANDLSRVDLSPVSPSRTHGKYTQLYVDSIAHDRHPQGKIPSHSHKPSPSIKVTPHDRNLDQYERHSQGPQTANNVTTIDRVLSSSNKHCLTDNGKDIESNTPKTTVKRLPRPIRNFSNSATNIDKSTKHYPKVTTPKSIVYPIKDLKASEGKYNIAKAEAEWRKRYGKLPYNKKDPLHQSSDKEFGRLFQQSERKNKTQSSSKMAGLAMNSSSLEGEINDTSSSSLFSPNRIENEKRSSKNSQAKDFSATLNQLSSYVLSGYKADHPQSSQPNNQENSSPEITVKYKRYYLDDEGDLSHILDDLNESPKLSMLVHAIIRLREVYSTQRYTKPQTPEHSINLGNPQLRDAIQNKPMSVVKDLILANKSVDINIRSQSGNSALHRAASEGDIDAIRIMINHGGNVNIRDRNGFQPVHQALRCHHYKAAMFLMDCGTDLMSYTSKRIHEFVNVKAIAKQYLRQSLKTPL